MPDLRNPTALISHAVQVGDWRLVELLARLLSGSGHLSAAQRAYGTLVLRLGLSDPGNHRG